MEYIEAVRSMEGSDFRIIFKHILPNVISPVIVVATLEMAKIILMEASLSYLGLGVPLEIPTWGRMLSEARVDMVTSPSLAILPGLLITLTVLGINLLGDWLRDYMDPRLDV
ncbi:Glutathione transport system permease protein GsiD [compost metagenome]